MSSMRMDQIRKKRAVAEAALEFVRPGSVLGVGTGSTTDLFIDALAEREVELDCCVSSSEASTRRLRGHGFSVASLSEAGMPELYVDGADESDRMRRLIKGGGGALTREKIVAEASETFVCIVDDSKIVERLGRFPLPVEVIPLAGMLVVTKLKQLGGRPERRDGFVTDNGNIILDVHDLSIDDPEALESEINQIPGVVCNGLFARRPADLVLIATDSGVERLAPPG